MAGGGAEKVLTTLLKHINIEKFDVTLCSIVNTGVQRLQIPQYINYTFIIPDPDSCTFWWRRFLYCFKYKLVYKWLPLRLVYQLWIPKGHDVEVAWVEGFATKLLSHSSSTARKIAWVHCDLYVNHWSSRIFKSLEEEYKCYSIYDLTVGVSQSSTKAILKLFGDNIPTITLYNPINSNEIISLSKKTINLHDKKDHSLRICSIGRYVPIKAFDRLLQITKQLINDGHKIELWLLGDGPLRGQYEQYISDNNLQNAVTLWGFQQNPYPYLAASDIFVCSSISEGYSTAVTEALILGKPIVTADCSGMRELLGSDCGIITDNDEESLYNGIKEMIEISEARQQYAENALKRGAAFSLQSLITPIETVLYGISSNRNI